MRTRHLMPLSTQLRTVHLPVASFLAMTLATCLSMSSPLAAQTVGGEWTTLHQFDGPNRREQMGFSVAGAGDVNGDGHPDMVFGVFGFMVGNKAYVRSGLDGRLLWELFPEPTFSGQFGYSVAGAGDVNADGFADLIVGAPESDGQNGTYQTGSAYVFSGLDGSLLHRFDGEGRSNYFGVSTAGAGDVNQDSYSDLIVGAIGTNPNGGLSVGSAYVYSGFDGSLLFQFDGSASGDSFGGAVAGNADINGDLYPDLIVGARGTSGGGQDRAGSAFVYSGFDGSVLLQFHGPDVGSQLGTSVAFAGDVNRDGTPDLIIGAWGVGPAGSYSGSAFVYSGVDGSLLYEFFGISESDNFGYSVDGAGDVDRDGYADLIIGAFDVKTPGGISGAGSAYVFSGGDGGLLFSITAPEGDTRLGLSVAGAGDMNGDGFPEMLVGAPKDDPGGRPEAGSVHVIGIDPFLTTNAEALSATNGTHLILSVDFPATEGGYSYALLLSATGAGPTNLNGVDIPLTADTLFNRMLTGWAPPVLPNAFGTLDLNGDADVLAVSHPYLTPFIGQTYYAAAVSYDPVGLVPRLSSVVRSVVIVP